VTVKALRNISFITRGSAAPVGHNAPAIHPLKTIAGVYQPVQGRILASGTVTPPFDVLPGFDPRIPRMRTSGTAGMLFGLSQAEVERILPCIEEFSELGSTCLPVRTYSTE
jgi:ABC-type polysaccharide/polyol phosphate transport system ATPase subunit